MSYGPELTPKQKAKLEREIRDFDKNKTLREIERESVSKPDVNAYENWVEQNGGAESYLANPDTLQEIKRGSELAPIDWQFLASKMEISEVLSYRQRQVWNLCMKQNKTLEEASQKLNIKLNTVAAYLKTAKEKVKRHFNA